MRAADRITSVLIRAGGPMPTTCTIGAGQECDWSGADTHAGGTMPPTEDFPFDLTREPLEEAARRASELFVDI